MSRCHFQQRKELIIELSIGVGIPVIGIGLRAFLHFTIRIHIYLYSSHLSNLDYIVQGHRGDIIQGLGCWNTTYNSIASLFLFQIWPCILSLIAITYGIHTIRAFLRRRNTVEEFLNSHSSGLNADRYFRLMCFSAIELIIAFPLGLYQLLYASLNNNLRPWISWDDVHSNYNRFNQVPAIFFTTSSNLQFSLVIWAFPLLAFIFFVFFGLGREQTNRYKSWFYTLLKPFGIKPPAPNPYNPDHRTWWQKLLRRPASYGTDLTSRGPTDSLPAFRHDASKIGTYPEKQIPSARSRIPHTASFDASLAFDYDDKLDTESDISGAKYHSDHPQPEGMLDAHVDMNQPLPGSHGDGDSDGEKDAPQMRSLPSTSSISSRRVSAVIRDVELSETEVRAMEDRVQQIA